MKFFLVINTILFFFVQSVIVQKKEIKQSSVTIVEQSKLVSKQDNIIPKPTEIINTINKSTNHNKSGNAILLLSGLAVALSGLGLSYANKNASTKLTRWAKANPKKTQFLIAGTQIGLMGLAFYQGYNLKMMGYTISTNLEYVFPILATIGFASIPFFPKSQSIVFPKKIAAKKLGFLTVALASLLNVTSLGNHIVTDYPNIAISQSVKSVDEYLVGATINSDKKMYKNSEETSDRQNKRKAVSAGITFLGIIGFLVLICTLCAGVCMIGLAAGSLGAVFGGLALAILSILGMVAIANGISKKKNK
jgi:hypothetical protein